MVKKNRCKWSVTISKLGFKTTANGTTLERVVVDHGYIKWFARSDQH
jgi:hypothetical protein